MPSHVISSEQFSPSSDQSTQPSQPAPKSSEPANSLGTHISFTAVLAIHTAFSATFRVFWCGLSSPVFTTAAQHSDQPSHSSSNSSLQSKHVDDSHPLQPPRKGVLLPRLSHNLHNNLQLILSRLSSFLLLLRNPECLVLPIHLHPLHLAGFRLRSNHRP